MRLQSSAICWKTKRKELDKGLLEAVSALHYDYKCSHTYIPVRVD